MIKTILSCIIVAIIFSIIGFAIGFNIKANNDKQIMNNNSNNAVNLYNEEDLVGTYRTSVMKDTEYLIILNSDMSCISWNGTTGTWRVDGDTVYMNVISKPVYYDGGENIGEKELTYDALIVDKGLYMYGRFYEKVK